jgi:molecular chaperone DnaJ
MDYYKTLGVSKNASKDEIKRAYRKLAHQYHPDKKGGDEKKFKEINAAYQVLGDERKKAHYDQFGSNFGSQGGGGGFQGFDFNNFSGFGGRGFSARGGPADGWDFGDIFSEFFGGGAGTRARAKQRGQDIKIDIVTSLEEAYAGIEREISLRKNVVCVRCTGSKGEPGAPIVDCKACGGSGEIRQTHRTVLGSITQVHTCGACGGEGKIPEKKCAKCRGAGIIQGVERIRVKVPAGIHSGEHIEFRGKGEAGPGGAGNLYAEVHIKEHPKFEREGDDIFSNLEIFISQAALGDRATIPTLAGSADITIPSGTETGAMVKLQGRGMKRLYGAGYGDHYARITVKTPQRLSKRAKELFEELKREGI